MERRPHVAVGGIRVLGAALLLASFAVPAQMLGEVSSFTAPGRIEAANQPMAIGAAESGLVSAIMVSEGSRVQTGQLLVKLDCGALEADVRSREARLAATRASTSLAATDPDRPAPLQETVGEETGGALDALASEPDASEPGASEPVAAEAPAEGTGG